MAKSVFAVYCLQAIRKSVVQIIKNISHKEIIIEHSWNTCALWSVSL